MKHFILNCVNYYLMKHKYSSLEELGEILARESQIKANIVPVVDSDNEDLFFSNDVDVSHPLPVLPLLDQVLFPGVIIPIAAQRPKARRLLKEHESMEDSILVFPQVNDQEDPTASDLYSVGVVAHVLKTFDIREDTTVAILQGACRVTGLRVVEHEPYMQGYASILPETFEGKDSKTFAKKMKLLRKRYTEILRMRTGDDDMSQMMSGISSDRLYINFTATHIDIDLTSKCQILEEGSYSKRIDQLLDQLVVLKGVEDLRHEIDSKTQEIIGKQQREYFLRHQMDVIQEELGENGSTPWNNSDAEALSQRAATMQWPDAVKMEFEKELGKLSRLQSFSPEYSVQLSYLETLLDLPWGDAHPIDVPPAKARKKLDRDHYGITKVKERIIEYLAVARRQGRMGRRTQAQVLCLVGPPGTGKTSVCRSVAEAMNRPYVRVALGGLHDEAEIRGHRRTYVGAMPGRIIQEMIKAGKVNPVFVLDEIDKVQTNSFHGDPSSALLEVLDPEQNCHFHDNFLGVDYDLSQVFFIATANSVADIQPALLDRMEIIDFSGYVIEEKIEIAKRHLVPKQMHEAAIDGRSLRFGDEALRLIINDYTREAGVRQLEKQIGRIVRHRVVEVDTNTYPGPSAVTPEKVREVLGLPIHNSERARTAPAEGVVTGLAWTPVGGEILFIESSTTPGKGQLSLTGNLGDVMKESATLAFEYIKSNAALFDIDFKQLEKTNIHIHVPEGATPKDGPSAGITMFTAMLSALTHRKVQPHVAMTGEITLRGDVTPVGGIKEKILAARRAGITDIVLCNDNQRDVNDIEPEYLTGLQFHYIGQMAEVLPIAFAQNSPAAPRRKPKSSTPRQ